MGKRTLKEQIPADKYLFTDHFHKAIQEEHDHANTNTSTNTNTNTNTSTDTNTNRKLVAQPSKPQGSFFQGIFIYYTLTYIISYKTVTYCATTELLKFISVCI